jgi:hypothetical protein
LLVYFLQGDVTLALADEGFLCHGAWRKGMGAVPVFDFQSFDPDRCYWSSLWNRPFGVDLSIVRSNRLPVKGLRLRGPGTGSRPNTPVMRMPSPFCGFGSRPM